MVTLVLLCVSLLQAGRADASGDELARKVRQAVRLDTQIQKDFTYFERRRDVRISKLGKVTIGPERTFEVYPSDQHGRTYKRLIAINGLPLSAEELAQRDAQHQRDLREAAETEHDRSERLARTAEEQREREQILDDAFAVFAATIVGRDTIDGQPVIVADVRPREEASVKTREGRWMKAFAGRAWISEADSQIVKIDMHAARDVTIGWGVIGRISKGSRVLFVRRRFENAWLPAETTYEARGRTLLFRTFQFSVTTTYSNYRRRR
jgi:hypothetical protein